MEINSVKLTHFDLPYFLQKATHLNRDFEMNASNKRRTKCGTY